MSKRLVKRPRTTAQPRRGIAMALGASLVLGIFLAPSAGGALAVPLDDPSGVTTLEAPLDDPSDPAETPPAEEGPAEPESPNEANGDETTDPTDAVPSDEDAVPAGEAPADDESPAPVMGPIAVSDPAFLSSVLGDLVPGIGACSTTLWQGPRSGTVLGGSNLVFDAQGPPAGPFKRVDGNDLQTLALNDEGYAYSWGTNTHLELGVGTFATTNNIPVTRPVPVSAPLGQSQPMKFEAVSAGATHSLALTANAEIYAWGTTGDPSGLGVGLGNVFPFRAMTLVGAPLMYGTGVPTPVLNPNGVKFIAIAAGTDYSLALSESGTIYSWGGSAGTGNGSGVKAQPTVIPSLAAITFESIAAGNNASFGVTTGGEAYGWGNNASGKLGIGQTMQTDYVPTRLPFSNSVKFKQISTSWWNTVALTVDGNVYTWGSNRVGALGIGSDNWDSSTPTPVAIYNPTGIKFSEVAAGSVWAMALANDGSVYTWGNNQWGQLANGSVVQTGASRPAKVQDSIYGPVSALHLAASNDSGFALSNSGILFGWGRNSTGALGNGTSSTAPTPVMGMVIAQQGAKATAYFGDPPPAGVPGPAGVQIVPDLIPDPVTILLTVPVPPHVSGPTPVYLQWDNRAPVLSGCYNYMLDLSLVSLPSLDGSTATLQASVDPGEIALIGDAKVDFSLPTGVTTVGGAAATKVAFDPVTGVASLDVTGTRGKSFLVSSVAKVGTVEVSNKATTTVNFSDSIPTSCSAPIWAAGSPDSGSVQGFPKSTHRIGFPVPSSNTRFVEVSAGKTHSLALDDGGNVWAWGVNNFGQLGNGNTVPSPTPVMVLGPDLTGSKTLEKVKHISAGAEHSLALTESGTLFQWGNSYGLGAAASSINSVPSSPTGVKFKEISAGSYFSLGLTDAGTVYSWGQGAAGQLGLGFSGNTTTPTLMTSFTGQVITQISAGLMHSLALNGNGRVFSWGSNTSGTIGNGQGGSTQGPSVFTPYMISESYLSGIAQVSAGESTSWAVSTNNSVFGWGQRDIGVGSEGSGRAFPGATYPGTTNTSLPSPVPGLNSQDVKQIIAGDMQFYALTKTGTLLGWGINGATGQLGLGSAVQISGPVEMMGGGSVLSVAPSAMSTGQAQLRTANFSLAIAASGELTGWGSNGSNQLTSGLGNPQTVPRAISAGTAGAAPTAGTAYFGNPTKGPGVDGYVTVALTGVTAGGTAYAQVPAHAAGETQVFVVWSNNPTELLYGCYNYQLELSLKVEPSPAPADGVATVIASVPAVEKDLTGASVVDFEIPDLKGATPPLVLDAGANVNGVAFVNGSASTAVKLATPRPSENKAGGGWEYPSAATARIGSSPVGGSDLNAKTVSNRPEAPIRFAPSKKPIYVFKVAESTSSLLVGMPGSEWTVYPDKAGAADLANPVSPGPTVVPARVGLFHLEMNPGVYWLEESKALAGFELLAQRVQFTVRDDGGVTLGTRANGNSPNIRLNTKGNGGTIQNTIQVEDVPSMVLPKAGGEGAIPWLTLLGVLLLAVAALGVGDRIIPRKRRRGSRHGIA